ncbi:MAG: 2-C-methyl-D-erythritol 2,4-cyclodiphosphate synthase [Phascolarctobacterium sp.]|nr:2-C-methyl-D-erythritol 2,4-cyclodiphosphate synthase [Phascolarctobacterium sp.]
MSDFKMPDFRVGTGFDVHKLVPGRKCIICGVEIPHETGLLGHSDADVALHALMDAILGAAALGDIGRHFPDTDERFKGADSMKLTEHVLGLIKEKGYVVNNVDVTIIAQAPKMAPHIEKMRINIAKVLEIDLDRVNVKATTTEKMGFTGRKEGIAAEAIASIMRNS